jgi:hypothetical protein
VWCACGFYSLALTSYLSTITSSGPMGMADIVSFPPLDLFRFQISLCGCGVFQSHTAGSNFQHEAINCLCLANGRHDFGSSPVCLFDRLIGGGDYGPHPAVSVVGPCGGGDIASPPGWIHNRNWVTSTSESSPGWFGERATRLPSVYTTAGSMWGHMPQFGPIFATM